MTSTIIIENMQMPYVANNDKNRTAGRSALFGTITGGGGGAAIVIIVSVSGSFTVERHIGHWFLRSYC